MDQANSSFIDVIFGLFDGFIDIIFESFEKDSGDFISLKVCLIIAVIIGILNILITIWQDKTDDFYYYDDDDDDIDGFFSKDSMCQRVPFSKKGYICYFDNYVKLQHDDIYVSNELADIQDIKLNENHNLVINHDGYEETIDSFKVSYVAYNFIKSELLAKKVC